MNFSYILAMEFEFMLMSKYKEFMTALSYTQAPISHRRPRSLKCPYLTGSIYSAVLIYCMHLETELKYVKDISSVAMAWLSRIKSIL